MFKRLVTHSPSGTEKAVDECIRHCNTFEVVGIHTPRLLLKMFTLLL